ncbi:Protein TIC 40 chloroplastic [Bienertia sinuspersici]
MENLALVSLKPVMGLSYSPNYKTLSTKPCFGLPILSPKPTGFLFASKPRSKTVLSAFSTPNSRRKASQSSNNEKKDNKDELFASTSATANRNSAQETTSVGVNPQPYAPPPSQFGSPLFWIGIGVGLSVVFSFVSSRLQKYAMQQAFKTMMGQMGSQNNQFSSAPFSPGSPFPYPPPPTLGSSTSGFTYQPSSTFGVGASSAPAASAPSQATSSAASEATVAADFSATETESSGPAVAKDEPETNTETKKTAFVDVSAEETFQNAAFDNYNDSSSSTSSEAAKFAEVVQNGAASKENTSDQAQSAKKDGSLLSVDTLEKMMEDPTVQKMVFPHLPEEMRNPDTFKWMLQNPVYRQQLQEMLDNMGGNAEWDNRMVDNLKNFDLNSPEVKQQFDQIGLTPEEVISKIMANPDIAMAFQNPRVQQAIMDVSQNPMNMTKYQNDKEVMDVFNKIQQLFPGTAGPF